jgi:hypothetical protein
MGSVYYSNDQRTDDHRSWFYEHRIEVLLLNELVRSRIARYTNGGRKRAGVVNEIEKAFDTGTTAGFVFGISVAGNVFLQGLGEWVQVRSERKTYRGRLVGRSSQFCAPSQIAIKSWPMSPKVVTAAQ